MLRLILIVTVAAVLVAVVCILSIGRGLPFPDAAELFYQFAIVTVTAFFTRTGGGSGDRSEQNKQYTRDNTINLCLIALGFFAEPVIVNFSPLYASNFQDTIPGLCAPDDRQFLYTFFNQPDCNHDAREAVIEGLLFLSAGSLGLGIVQFNRWLASAKGVDRLYLCSCALWSIYSLIAFHWRIGPGVSVAFATLWVLIVVFVLTMLTYVVGKAIIRTRAGGGSDEGPGFPFAIDTVALWIIFAVALFTALAIGLWCFCWA